MHLQGIGKWIKATDIVLDRPAVKQWLGIKKTISLAMAQRWMCHMGYHWKKTPGGQFVDGHEREDVVHYCQTVFLSEIEIHTRVWAKDNIEIIDRSQPCQHPIVVWFHGRLTFYANNHWKVQWVHNSETPVPQPKGEGVSLMVADFVSAYYGWLQSLNGKEQAQVLFEADKK